MGRSTLILAAIALGATLSSGVGASRAADRLELLNPSELIIGYNPADGAIDVKDGKPVGVFGLIMTRVAEKLKLRPVFESFDFPALIPALQAARVDVAGPFSITQRRAQIMYLTTPIFLQPEAIAVREGTQISSWKDAAAKKLTLATGVGYFQIPIWEDLGIKLHTFDTMDACLMDVVNHGADGCEVGAFDLIYRQATEAESPVAKLKVIPISGSMVTADLNSFGVRKNSPELAAAVSQAITDLWRDGSIEAAYRETFKNAPYSLFLNAPVGLALYVPGPWTDGMVPPPAKPATPKTIAAGVLTVGITADTPLLHVDGGGPEGVVINKVATALGFRVNIVKVADGVDAINKGLVDIVAGQLAESEPLARKIWFSQPIGFNSDYIYVKPGHGGTFPAYGSWEDAAKNGGRLVVVAGSDRIAALTAAGVAFDQAPDAKTALEKVVAGESTGFVGSTVDFVSAVARDQRLTEAGLGWVRNTNSFTAGEIFAWGLKVGNSELADALDAEITRSWQNHDIPQAYARAFPQVNVTALTAPGPTAIGTSFDASKDCKLEGVFLAGPWTQRKGWNR